MRTVLVLLMAFSLMAFAQAINNIDKFQNVGGNFGRAWLVNNLAPNNNESNESKATDLRNLSEADPLSEDWLGIVSPIKASNKTLKKPKDSAEQESPYSINKIITPVHQIDASWNQTYPPAGQPEPDRNGLINGIPAELYYSIGPAYFNF